MANFSVYAEVLTPEHNQMKAYAAGVKKNPPGVTLQSVLERSGGAYEAQLDFTPEFREQIRQVGRLTSDKKLLAIADQDKVVIPLHHLRGIDPQTLIILGYRLTYGPGESERLGLGLKGAPDPRTTFLS
jgi:hypothetical protein